jgi:L-ascorbate metabolism protein UlaG (beta-lactamase superfamily)
MAFQAKALSVLASLLIGMGINAAQAQNVKITPLGSHDGELCERDRATLFEDPTGVRILYDAGQSLTGGDDPRLGDVHLVLLSHAHGDHMGDRKLRALGAGAGTCDKVDTVSAAPHSTTAEVAAAKNAAIMMVSPMGAFIARKIQNITGKPTGNCPEKDGVLNVPFAASCSAVAQLGGTRILRAPGATAGVEVTIVPASHDSTVSRELLTDPQKAALAVDNTSLYLGPPSGYIIKFTNGLTVYLSGDTGIHAEMKTVVADYHKANLAMLNFGASAISAYSATFAMNELIRPAAVIATHVNERATSGGKLLPGTRTATLVKMQKRPVHLAISGRTMEFDGKAQCLAGCN